MAFPGSVFAPAITGRMAAEVDPTPSGLRVALTDGTRWDLPWRELQLTQGGNDQAMTFLTHTDGRIVCCAESGFLAALAEKATVALATEARRLHTARTHTGAGRGAFWLAASGLIIALLVGAWLLIPWAAERSIEALPPTIDRELGDRSYAGMDVGGAKIEVPEADVALTTIVSRLSAHTATPFDFRIQVVDAPQINAFALPGGQIVVYTGLLRKAARPEQVAGVIAHEMAHVTLRHGLRGIAKQVGVLVGVQVLTGDLSGLAAQVATAAISNAYSRDAEREADAEGARMLAAAGIDPHGLGEFFALLEAEGTAEGLPWLSSHPDHGERAATLDQLIPTLPGAPITALDIDWPGVQAALPAVPVER